MNLLVMCAISGFRVYDHYIENRRDLSTIYYLVGIQAGLLMILVWAYVVVIRDYVNEYYSKKKYKEKEIIFDMFDQEKIRKLEMTTFNSALFKQKVILQSFNITELNPLKN